VLFAPLDVVLGPDTVLQPDVLVARRADLAERNLPAAPVLAVEVLSPSSRHIDLASKRLAFEAAGVPTYWVVDPDEPSLRVFEHDGSRLVEVARVRGGERHDTSRPFPVTLSPATLVE
jgi:Uma2 family endonuclease